MNATTPPNTPALQSVVVAGVTCQVDANGAAAIKQLQDSAAALKASLDKAEGSLAAITETNKSTVAAKDAEIQKLKDAAPDAARLDALVVARSRLIGDAKKILGDSFDAAGKSDAEIKRAAVGHGLKLGDAALKEKSDGYIDASFDTLVIQAGDGRGTGGGDRRTGDDVRDHMRDNGGNNRQDKPDAAKAREDHIKRVTDAWKPPAQAQR